MPHGDRTGPAGMGSMTGRAAGYCAGYFKPGFANIGFFGKAPYGRGGRGYRHRYYATGLPYWARFGSQPQANPYYGTPVYDRPVERQVSEEEVLKDQAEVLRKQLAEIEQRLEGLEDK